MNLTELVKSITRREWLVVAAVALVLTLLTSFPPLYGWLVGLSRGQEWNGLQFFSPGDFGVYLSYINQARGGAFFLDNIFAVGEPTVPVVNLLWWSVGLLARLTSLGPVAAFYVARSLSVLPLAAACYLAVSFFLRRRTERLVAFLLLMFGSGWGALAAPFLNETGPSISWPIDLWVPESNLFASQIYSPHFVVSWTLLILSMLLLAVAYESGRSRYGLLAGLVALLLFEFHPFHAPTLYAAGFFGWLTLAAFRRDGAVWRRLTAFVLFVAVSFPAVAYHYLLLNGDGRLTREIAAANVTLTPGWPYVLLGFGLPLILAPVGLFLCRRNGSPRLAGLLAVWALSHLVLSYLPFSFQRRFLEGAEFPLGILAVPVVVLAVGRLIKTIRMFGRSIVPAIGLFLFLFLFLLSAFASSIDIYASILQPYRHGSFPNVFFSSDESTVLDWIRENTSDDASFIGSGVSGYLIAGWTGRRVLFGHWVNSGDMERRQSEIEEFFGRSDEAERVEFMQSLGLTHIFVGTRERAAAGGEFVIGRSFRQVYASGGFEVYELGPDFGFQPLEAEKIE